MSVQELIMAALKVMGVGVGMVFAVLALFYGLVKLLMFVFPAKRGEQDS